MWYLDWSIITNVCDVTFCNVIVVSFPYLFCIVYKLCMRVC